MGNLSNLTWMFVSDNNLGGQIPENLNNLTLDRLWLHKNSFTGCVPYNLTLTREYKVDSGLPACEPPGAAPTPAPTQVPGSTDARLASIEARLATLEQRLSVLEAIVARAHRPTPPHAYAHTHRYSHADSHGNATPCFAGGLWTCERLDCTRSRRRAYRCIPRAGRVDGGRDNRGAFPQPLLSCTGQLEQRLPVQEPKVQLAPCSRSYG